MTPETAAGLDAATDAREAAEAALEEAWAVLVDALGADEEATRIAVERVEAAELVLGRARIVERGWGKRAHAERPFVAGDEEVPDPRGAVTMRAIGALSDPTSPRRIIAPGQRFTADAAGALHLAASGLAEVLGPRPAWWPANQPTSLRASSA